MRADCRYKLGASWHPQLGKPRGSGECLFVFRLPRTAYGPPLQAAESAGNMCRVEAELVSE